MRPYFMHNLLQKVSLHKLLPPKNRTIFERHPRLNYIWQIQAMQERAEKSYCEWDTEDKTGEIFLILKNKSPIGITGWWPDEKIHELLRLRWHGILPEERGRGYSETALTLLLQRLSSIAPPQYLYLSESVSIKRVDAAQVQRHFEKLGFKAFDDPTYGNNGYGKVQSLRVRLLGR